MILRLTALEVENFKGVKKASYEFGDETHFFGKNATGKSTIADAFFWLLFDRDSRGNTPGSDRFREKPLDENGQERHHLDTMVVAKCTLDGNPFVLKRVQREGWVTKRGSKDAVYQGNGSTYWINDVETKATEYKARINGIANGDLFSLVARLGAFNALDEKARRTILINMADINVDDVLLAKEEYAPIAAELQERGIGIDDLKKVLSDQRRDINKELNLIPAKIDEVNHMMPTYTEQEIHEADLNVKDTEADIQRCRNEIAAHEAGDDTSRIATQKLLQAQTDLVNAKKRIIAEHDTQRMRLENELHLVSKQQEVAQRSLETAKAILSRANRERTEAEKKLEQFRTQYRLQYNNPFVEGDRPEVCQLCGQTISDEAWEASVQRRREYYEGKKKEALDEISRKGKEQGAVVESAKEAEAEAQEAVVKAENEVDEANNCLQTAKDALNNFPKEPNLDTEEIRDLETKANQWKVQASLSSDSITKSLNEQIDRLQERQNKSKAILAKVEQKKEFEKRIKELTEMQKTYGEKKADIELKVFSIERFISERCSMLEEGINSRFSTVRWKLFNQQINGAIVDCCECMVPGDGILMPYSGTNTAARINADIEIIDVLSRHFDIIAPVFVDNAECVNYISKPMGQLITLSVSTDEELRCEIKNKEEK